MVADPLPGNLGAMTAYLTLVNNFSLQQLAVAQREHEVWKVVIYALESVDQIA